MIFRVETNTTDSSSCRNPKYLWLAPTAMLPISIFLTALTSVTEIPLNYWSPKIVAGGIIFGIYAGFRVLWAPILFFVQAAAILKWEPRRRFFVYLRRATALAVGLGVCFQSYYELIKDSKFAEYPVFAAIYLAAGLVFAFWLLSFRMVAEWVYHSKKRRRIASIAVSAVFLVAAAAAHVGNRIIVPDTYATFHLSLCQLGFLLLNAGAALLLVCNGVFRRSSKIESMALWILYIAVSFAFIVPSLASTSHFETTRALHRRFTTLGQSESILEEKRSFKREGQTATTLYEPNGEKIFAKYSNLSTLDQDAVRGKNILLITIEAMRYRDSSFGDIKSDLTPNFRKFASLPDSFLFHRAYSPSATTLQVFSGIMSMAPVSMSEVELWSHWHGRLRPKAVTVSEILKKDQYQTFYAGHNYRGRFSKKGLIKGLQQGFDTKLFASSKNSTETVDDTDIRVVSHLKHALEKTKESDRPFFGWVFLVSPHEPYYERYPEMKSTTEKDRYRQEIRYADERLGEIMAILNDSGIWDNTIVILCGDHGEAFMEHKKKSHADVYTETTHVAAAIRIPGIKGGKIAAPVSSGYFLPWILEKGPTHARKASREAMRRVFAPLMKRTDGAVVVEMLRPKGIRTALITKKYELIYDDASEHIELYDLVKDPMQKRDIYSPEDPASVQHKGYLEEYLTVRATLSEPLHKKIVADPRKK